MVLRLKTRESRSLPGLQIATSSQSSQSTNGLRPNQSVAQAAVLLSTGKQSILTVQAATLASILGKTNQVLRVGAGWSSPVARQAHNLKAAGSNPAPATNLPNTQTYKQSHLRVAFGVEAGGGACEKIHQIQPAWWFAGRRVFGLQCVHKPRISMVVFSDLKSAFCCHAASRPLMMSS